MIYILSPERKLKSRRLGANRLGDAKSKQAAFVGRTKMHAAFQIVYCTLKSLAHTDIGSPLHSLIIPGTLHHIESEMLRAFEVD